MTTYYEAAAANAREPKLDEALFTLTGPERAKQAARVERLTKALDARRTLRRAFYGLTSGHPRPHSGMLALYRSKRQAVLNLRDASRS